MEGKGQAGLEELALGERGAGLLHQLLGIRHDVQLLGSKLGGWAEIFAPGVGFCAGPGKFGQGLIVFIPGSGRSRSRKAEGFTFSPKKHNGFGFGLGFHLGGFFGLVQGWFSAGLGWAWGGFGFV